MGKLITLSLALLFEGLQEDAVLLPPEGHFPLSLFLTLSVGVYDVLFQSLHVHLDVVFGGGEHFERIIFGWRRDFDWLNGLVLQYLADHRIPPFVLQTQCLMSLLRVQDLLVFPLLIHPRLVFAEFLRTPHVVDDLCCFVRLQQVFLGGFEGEVYSVVDLLALAESGRADAVVEHLLRLGVLSHHVLCIPPQDVQLQIY